MEKTDLTDFLDDFSQTAGDLCLQAGRELDVELPQAANMLASSAVLSAAQANFFIILSLS